MFTHPCIKCGEKYEDEDPDAYYCPPCNEERLRIAKEIDAKRPSGPQPKTPSALELYDAAEKVRGFISAKDIM